MEKPGDLPIAKIRNEMIDSLKLGKMPVAFEDTDLEDVKREFGGTLGSRGDAGDAEGWLCMLGADKTGPWVLWVLSFEASGPKVGGIQWRRLAAGEVPDSRCFPAPKNDGGVRLPLAIYPGMKEAEARRIMGPPTLVRGTTLFYCHVHQALIGDVIYNASNTVVLVLKDRAVWSIQVTKSTLS
jgi:hypothetical protein